jgi:signal transduction histidine kinase
VCPSKPDDESEPRERLAVVGEIAAEVAHELRNVLLIVSASAFVARHALDRGDATAARPHVAKVEKHARIAQGIVDDLMSLARGEPLRAGPILLSAAVVAARAELGADNASWVDTFDPRETRVCAHHGLLARLLHVLYENAIHASAPRPPTIATRVRTEPGRVVIEVADDGPGIPPELAARVFEPLVSGRSGGTGLGLSLARRIARAHGGSIELVAPLAGPSGATFRIELPGESPSDSASPSPAVG